MRKVTSILVVNLIFSPLDVNTYFIVVHISCLNLAYFASLQNQSYLPTSRDELWHKICANVLQQPLLENLFNNNIFLSLHFKNKIVIFYIHISQIENAIKTYLLNNEPQLKPNFIDKKQLLHATWMNSKSTV